jgi:hypothetical protein
MMGSNVSKWVVKYPIHRERVSIKGYPYISSTLMYVYLLTVFLLVSPMIVSTMIVTQAIERKLV